MTPSKIKYLFVLICYEIFVAFFAAFIVKSNVLSYIFLSWTIPSLFILYKLARFSKKIIINTFVWAIPGSVCMDLLAHYTDTWSHWWNPLFASTGIRIAGDPIESFIWGVSFWLFYLLIYEFFFDRHRSARPLTLREKLLTFLLILTPIAVTYTIVSLTITVGSDRYFFGMIIISIIVDLVLLWKYPHLIKRIILFGLIAILLGIIIESVALSIGYWDFFAEKSVLVLNYFGKVLPIEELAWWLLIPTNIALIYELISDTKD